MIRALFRLMLIVVILAAAAAFFFGYRFGDEGVQTPVSARQAPTVDTAKAREAGAKIGETVATGAAQAQQSLSDGALTAKIKAKMALDDLVKAADIDVDTEGSVVTLTGDVGSADERRRAVRIATETAGVTMVVNHLKVR